MKTKQTGLWVKVALRFSFIMLLGFFAIGVQSAEAGEVYVGSYNVFEAPVWTSNPTVMSPTEVAAMLFGGGYTDYSISINPSLDPTTITYTGHMDGWGNTEFLQPGVGAPEDYSFSSNGGGYDRYPSFSAWVCDHADCAAYGYANNGPYAGLDYTNYVWRNEVTPVPEPSSLLFLGTGLLGLWPLARRRIRSV